MSYEQIIAEITDEFARGLLMHAYNEFTFLARILPALYAAENYPDVTVAAPWQNKRRAGTEIAIFESP